MNWFTHNGNIFRPFYPSLTWNRRTTNKQVYLTFDDGPDPEVTDYVLAVLNEYGLRATFFCIGENVSKHPVVYQKILSEGHSVGNHTYNHVNGFNTPTHEYIANTQKAAKHIDSRLFRPPFGRIKRKQIKALKSDYEIIMWTILTGDFDTSLHVEKAIKRVQSLTKPGAIVVFHDSQKAFKNLQELLPAYCAFLTKNGYTSCGL